MVILALLFMGLCAIEKITTAERADLVGQRCSPHDGSSREAQERARAKVSLSEACLW